MPASRFEAIIDGRSIELTIDEHQVTIDDQARSYSLRQTGSCSYSLLIDGRSASIVIEPLKNKQLRIQVDGHSRIVQLKDEQDLLLEEMGFEELATAAEEQIRAPMPGLVLAVHVEVGQTVAADEGLVVVEAMKMENELRSPVAGEVTAVHVTTGETVDKDQPLVEIDPQV